MSDDRCILSPACERGLHAADAFPCGKLPPRAGSPCEYCGQPLPAQDSAPQFGAPCPSCTRLATIADLKGLAAERGWDTTLRIGPTP